MSARAFSFSRRLISPHIPVAGEEPRPPQKTRQNPRNRRRHRPDVSRSGRRWRNCSIPRSTAAMPAWDRAPACSRRPDNSWDRRTGGEAAAHRARASTRAPAIEVAKRDAFCSSPPPAHAHSAVEGWGGGCFGAFHCRRVCRDTPTPNPSPALRGRERSRSARLDRSPQASYLVGAMEARLQWYACFCWINQSAILRRAWTGAKRARTALPTHGDLCSPPPP